MNIDTELYKYLSGKEFSNSLVVSLPHSGYIPVSREDAITRMTSGQSVIHVGCSDHIGLIDDKIKNGKWLHKLLTDSSLRCLGIDIDRESIEYITGTLGYNNVVCADITGDSIPGITEHNWDVAVFGELIEHLDNPVDFLKSFRLKYGSHIKRFIITVPSIYGKGQLKNMLKYKEIINSDHRFWFTPYTISKLLVSAGWIPEQIDFVNLSSLSTLELIKRKINRLLGIREKYPFYRFNTLIVSGNIS